MNEQTLPVFTSEQVRVFACLMEKHLATPKNYPLTPNSLTLACNQKSNRHPVMSLDEGKVVNVARHLNELGYVSIDHGDRNIKFSHRAPGMLDVSREEQAILAMLMLREPLTLNEIKARTEKMIGFDSIDLVSEAVQQLINRSRALVTVIPTAVRQKEERFTHLLAGEPDLSSQSVKPVKSINPTQSQKMQELEARIKRIEEALNLPSEQVTDQD